MIETRRLKNIVISFQTILSLYFKDYFKDYICNSKVIRKASR